MKNELKREFNIFTAVSTIVLFPISSVLLTWYINYFNIDGSLYGFKTKYTGSYDAPQTNFYFSAFKILVFILIVIIVVSLLLRFVSFLIEKLKEGFHGKKSKKI